MRAIERYLTQVLGIRHILRPESHFTEPSDSAFTNVTRLVWLVDHELDESKTELLKKMTAALGVLPSAVRVVRGTLDDVPSEIPFTVGLGKSFVPLGREWGELVLSGKRTFLATHGLKEMLANPALKKETWAHLKPVLESLKTGSKR